MRYNQRAEKCEARSVAVWQCSMLRSEELAIKPYTLRALLYTSHSITGSLQRLLLAALYQ